MTKHELMKFLSKHSREVYTRPSYNGDIVLMLKDVSLRYSDMNELICDEDQPKAVRAIFDGPATIVFWDDGEKTVVKCGECGSCAMKGRENLCRIGYDREKAVMAAMLKRLHRNFQDEVRAVCGDEGESTHVLGLAYSAPVEEAAVRAEGRR